MKMIKVSRPRDVICPSSFLDALASNHQLSSIHLVDHCTVHTMDAPDRKRLKSTYKPVQDLPPLPPGWTEHTAPTGTFPIKLSILTPSILTRCRSQILLQRRYESLDIHTSDRYSCCPYSASATTCLLPAACCSVCTSFRRSKQL